VTDTCERGHAYTPENTRLRLRTRPAHADTWTRVCRACEAYRKRVSDDRARWREPHALYLQLLRERGVLPTPDPWSA
jgi:hypothetical protein